MPLAPDFIIERGGDVSIVAANLFLLDAADIGGVELAEALGALPPKSWPPEHIGPEMLAWVRRLIAQHPDEPGYNTWFIIGARHLCGTAGFKGPPDADGCVEIGYSVVLEDQRKGFASCAVELLVARSFADPRVNVVKAETLPDGVTSQRVLLRCGFTQTGTRIDADDGEVVCFERRRL